MKERIQKYKDISDKHAQAKALEAELSKQKEAVKKEIIDEMQRLDITRSAEYEGIGSVTLCDPVLIPRYNEEDSDRVFEFLKRNGCGEVVKQTVHAQTFGKIIRELMADGKILPDFIKTDFYKQNITINRR